MRSYECFAVRDLDFGGGRKRSASYADYPVFENAPLKAIADVRADCMGNLHWPALDADIEIEALRRPQKFPSELFVNTKLGN